MIKFVFEDGEDTPSSRLLKKCLNGNYIYFSNGASQVLNKAINIQEDGDYVYIFYDVAPNNYKTVTGYNKINEAIKEWGYKNIISKQEMNCLKNKIVDNNKLFGQFYTMDCVCERKYCRINCTDNLEIKADRLYRMLPAIYVSSNKQLETYCKLIFDEICDNMGENKISIII